MFYNLVALDQAIEIVPTVANPYYVFYFELWFPSGFYVVSNISQDFSRLVVWIPNVYPMVEIVCPVLSNCDDV